MKAFDHFDSILCVGRHHLAEIKARETLYNLPCKELVQHGYGKLDALLASNKLGPRKLHPNDSIQVLIAPSWG